MKYLIPMLCVLPLVAACAGGPSKSDLDDEVRRLCAIDGGVKVYETVTLPAERFDARGSVKFFRPGRGESALGADYLFKEEDHYFQKGDHEQVAMWKTRTQVIRRSDMKLLGESVIYVRRGDDISGPWHPSSLICPDVKNLNLLERVFIEEQSGDQK